ncbi:MULTISPECIES: hypothetical protein [unclassified Gordonia (in: high G+C Gram-positive bacteria)]|uniref:hypothetical protein n=1 Tax=unclassified Gordonia (in: high G+C Gram-positive bacteria) TaxID=2657482 RepID=UPI001965FD92|nr:MULTISPECIES: hypothetical protein [unclassified Gordonia (in: high G+C Gram-positive bacteria)]MBN0974262.1 hypothetical protein [Gordonia sp. BP-119]MBN0981912.1 hypothetical protein [Gordonia sp. BP-94]
MFGRAKSAKLGIGQAQVAIEMEETLRDENQTHCTTPHERQARNITHSAALSKNRRLLTTNPAAAVASAFDDVSRAVREVVETEAPEIDALLPFEDRVRILRDRGLSKSTATAAMFLGVTRYDSVYSSDDAEAYVDAERFVSLADQVLTSLDIFVRRQPSTTD